MKIKTLFLTLATVMLVAASCGSASKTSGNSSTEYSNGRMAGAVLLKLASQYLSTGTIDFTNAQNILDFATLASSLTSLKKEASTEIANAANTTSSTLKDFVAGLENGSENKINSGNVSGVVSGLAALANSDLSALTNNAEKGRDSSSSMQAGLEQILSLFK